jgi:hypothetical protein
MVKTASDLICDPRACGSYTLAYLHMCASPVVPVCRAHLYPPQVSVPLPELRKGVGHETREDEVGGTVQVACSIGPKAVGVVFRARKTERNVYSQAGHVVMYGVVYPVACISVDLV